MTSVLYGSGNYQATNPVRLEINALKREAIELRKVVEQLNGIVQTQARTIDNMNAEFTTLKTVVRSTDSLNSDVQLLRANVTKLMKAVDGSSGGTS
jgi:uncharacterized coiled-coil DUF342 family protein